MKKLSFILLASLFVTVSCTKEDIFNTYDIAFGETITHNKNVELTFQEIQDSRCPTDVVCVWEGKADVRINVDSPQSGSILLSTYDNLIDTVGGYSFELIDVSPYPISTKTIKLKDYNVALKIVEL